MAERIVRYLRTNLATDWDQTKSQKPGVLIRLLLKVLPNSNPDYELHRVREWLIEFDEDHYPWREIGLDESGIPVLLGPDDRNYGFWLDTNMRYADFSGTEVSAKEFEFTWKQGLLPRSD